LKDNKTSKELGEEFKINPKYLFLKDYFDKIKKLRDIFVEFDADLSGNTK